MPTMTFLRTSSHRSRERLEALLGFRPCYFFTLRDGGCFVPVSGDMAHHVLANKPKGVTVARIVGPEPLHCWGSDDSHAPNCPRYKP